MDLYCERCGEELTEETAVWIEMATNAQYYERGLIPEEHSQGMFSFGSTCAKRITIRKEWK